jgi:type VI secretion system protein ImpM
VSGKSLDTERQSSLGFFGKLPSKGDFVSRGLPRSFLDPWDAWLQESLAASKNQLADDWLDCYLTGPIWHFVLDERICGDQGWCGVMMPSVDRVGRYFPLTVAAGLEGKQGPFASLVTQRAWFDEIGELVLAILDEDATTPGQLEERLRGIGRPPEMGSRIRDAAIVTEAAGPVKARIEAPDAAAACALLLDAAVRSQCRGCSLWWSDGSERVSSGLSLTRGLPAPSNYSAMLDGSWSRLGWRTSEVLVDADSPVESTRR